MTSAEKITVLLKRKKMTNAELATKLGTSAQNLSNKMKRDNFSEKELNQIAEALNCAVEVVFTMNDTKETL